MSFASDPHLESVHAPMRDEWREYERHHLVDADHSESTGITNSRRGWRLLGALVAAAFVIYAASLAMSALAIPLTAASAADAPAWMIELSATGNRSVTALIYGEEVGLQLVQVPSASEGQHTPRLIPARLAKGKVHIVSLGLSTLHARASAPKGAQPMSFVVKAPIITAFQNDKATGVRGGW